MLFTKKKKKWMSGSHSENRRLSSNGRNAYISINQLSENKNLYDREFNKNYLSIKPIERARSLSPSLNSIEVTFAPKQTNVNTCADNITKENINNQSVDTCVNTASVDKIDAPMQSEKSLFVKNGNLNENNNNDNININTQDSINNSLIINNKVQTGIDRYFSIAKRKSSPTTLRQEPFRKQPKNNTSSQIETMSVSQNRFQLLATTESDDQANGPVKEYKPPPIFLREQTNNALVNSLSQLIGKDNFHVVSIRRGNVSETKIQIYLEKNYRTVIQKFDSCKRNYYTYQLKSAKGLIVVIKGIDSSVPIDEIKSALELEGFEVKSIHNILNKNKVPQPLFRVEISFNSSQLKKGQSHPIYNLRYLLNRKITVEEPIKRENPPQCLNCQEFGHTKSYCKLPTVCVICGDVHNSKECPNSKTDSVVKKCSNCGQNHTANYRGCPVFLRLKQVTSSRRSSPAQYQNSHFPALPTANSDRTGVRTQQNIPPPQNFSYAHMLKESPPAQSNDSQSSIENLIKTMNNFMSNMQNMFQELMRNQSMLMQILLDRK